MQSLEQKRQHKASKRYDKIFAALPFVFLWLRRKKLHQSSTRYLISVHREYLDTGTKREDATGRNSTSMFKDAILLSVVMLLLCAVNHAHHLFSVEEQGAGVTMLLFSEKEDSRAEIKAHEDGRDVLH